MMTSKEKRDFIASEISKRLIGPGLTEGAFLCKEDASDEVLDNRSTVEYTGGILYPPKSNLADEIKEPSEDSPIDDEQTDNAEENITPDVNEPENVANKTDDKDNQLDLGIADRTDFKPSHIGLIACVNKDTKYIDVDVKYGIYHMLNESAEKEDNNVRKNVKVKLGRCTLEQLNNTFAYYDKSPDVLTEIHLFGAKKMEDLFFIDQTNHTISPKRIFIRNDADTQKVKYLQDTSFPELPRNKVATLLIKLFRNPEDTFDLPVGLNWDVVSDEIKKLEKLIPDLLHENNWANIIDNLTFNSENKKIRITNGRCTIPESINLYNILHVDDPVKTHLLPLLLKDRYFKREQKVLQTFKIPLGERTGDHTFPDSEGTLKLHWKIMSRFDLSGAEHKYIKILLENIRKKTSRQSSEDFVHQAELKISSPGIVSYSEPRRSSIADEEYDVNEILYKDIEVYAKGVNCGVKWKIADSKKEVMTTYTPSQLAVSFNPDSEISEIKDACDVHDLTIWSPLSKKEIIGRFKSLANAYEIWHKKQNKQASEIDSLKGILKEQEDFLERLRENIDYLDYNDDAYKCFQIANTAMYIQMVISRDLYFKKNRKLEDIPEKDRFDDDTLWERFKVGKVKAKYRPFQLSFLLMNIKSTFEDDDKYRNDNVDLIWFPTGGGKTEAYLALTAFTIAQRRLTAPTDDGISVIMRYTLRLLTAQQFERASFLICALEYLRKHICNDNSLSHYNLGNFPITIGMWIGQASSPNNFNELGNGKYHEFYRYLTGEINRDDTNPFPISYCPWCGCKMVAPGAGGRHINGYDNLYGRDRGPVHCINNNCCYNEILPIMFVDEQLYRTPPTLLFATVDKFARLRDHGTGEMFGCRKERRKPDLIIQDELHLISGPLGSLVGMYETMVEEVCTERDIEKNVLRRPKVIASTATTRNTKKLIKQLYTRDVRSFPVSGIKYDDNFFSKAMPLEQRKRMYMGISPTGHSASELEIRAVAAQIVAKEMLIAEELKSARIDLNNVHDVTKFLTNNETGGSMQRELDDYWTLVLYYTNLKSLGRAHSRIGQEIKSNAESMRRYTDEHLVLDFISNNFHQRVEEFTSRKESSRIKELLVEAEARTSIICDKDERMRVTSKMDVVQATNMISVGIDISRWNTMMIVGQPLTTAEYIQSSSRVGRTEDGLVVNLYNPWNTRELSLYENYLPYHQAFYKFVEPLMATSFTEQTVNKLVTNLYLCFMGAIKGYNNGSDVRNEDVAELKKLLNERNEKTAVYSYSSSFTEYIENEIDKCFTYFQGKELGQTQNLTNLPHPIMNSLRDIEADTYIFYDI